MHRARRMGIAVCGILCPAAAPCAVPAAAACRAFACKLLRQAGSGAPARIFCAKMGQTAFFSTL